MSTPNQLIILEYELHPFKMLIHFSSGFHYDSNTIDDDLFVEVASSSCQWGLALWRNEGKGGATQRGFDQAQVSQTCHLSSGH